MNRLANVGRLAKVGVAGGALVAGAYLIMPNEGEVLGTYVDPIGVVTACYGRTGHDLEVGQTFSREDCMNQLAEDLAEYDRQLMALVDVPLNTHQHAALLSFIYNVGQGNFRDSTLRRKLNAGDYEGACNELTRWVYAGGRVLPGLVNRRAQERAMCLGRLNDPFLNATGATHATAE